MKLLANLTGLSFDGGDNRLFAKTIFTNSQTYSEKEYDAMEKAIEKNSVIGSGFEVYAWNDCSGYNYWTVKQNESNYIQITVHITDANANPEEIKKAVEKLENIFFEYSLENI